MYQSQAVASFHKAQYRTLAGGLPTSLSPPNSNTLQLLAQKGNEVTFTADAIEVHRNRESDFESKFDLGASLSPPNSNTLQLLAQKDHQVTFTADTIEVHRNRESDFESKFDLGASLSPPNSNTLQLPA